MNLRRFPQPFAWLVSSCVLLIALLLTEPASASDHKDVFVLHSYSQEYPWTKRQHEGLLARLAKDPGAKYSFRTEYMDTKRVHYDQAYGNLLADHLSAKYHGYAPDAIYVTDDNALVFALDHLLRIFPSTPLFFSGVNNFGIKTRLDRQRVTGVFERKEIVPNLDLIRLVAPETKQIVVAGDASSTYEAIAREIRHELAKFPEIQARYVSNRQIDTVLNGLRSGSERFVILTTLGSLVDRNNSSVTLSSSVSAIAGLNRHTVISMEDVYLFDGVLGGYVTSGVAQGEAAANQIVAHFAGKPIGEIALVEKSPNQYLVDARELKRTGLVLPDEIAASATILNPMPSVFQRFERQILIALYILASLVGLSVTTSLVVVVRKNRLIETKSEAMRLQTAQMSVIQESLVRAQRIASLGNWDWDIEKDTFYWSEEIYRILGVDSTQSPASYQTHKERVHPDDLELVDTAMRNAVRQGAPFDISYRIVLPNQEIRIVEVSAEVGRNSAGATTRIIGTMMDITARKRSEDRLAFLANYDPVTGLPNRFLFQDRLKHAMDAARGREKCVGLLFIDLDNFKDINDSLGHAAGDELLKQVAARLSASVKVVDTVCRLGGDEFTVVIEGLKRDDEAMRVAADILERAKTPYHLGESVVYVTCSIGIAVYPRDGEKVDTLLTNADAAMYHAKQSGRNGFKFFTKAINIHAHERLHVGNELRGALARGEFSLHFQPKIIIADDSVVGFEALLRWHNASLGSVSPVQFIPILEDIGLIGEVGQWVLTQACRWAANLPESAGPPPGISVNLSARQFCDTNLENVVQRALSLSGLPAHRLDLEITESILMNLDNNREIMDRLKRLGVGLSIDDFGTGYSSLAYLKRFPVDQLKIDRSFVRDLGTDSDDAAIVLAIIGLAHNLNLRVIAEGVETAEQLEILRQHGCDEVQGYFLARPMPADEARQWLATRTSNKPTVQLVSRRLPIADQA